MRMTFSLLSGTACTISRYIVICQLCSFCSEDPWHPMLGGPSRGTRFCLRSASTARFQYGGPPLPTWGGISDAQRRRLRDDDPVAHRARSGGSGCSTCRRRSFIRSIKNVTGKRMLNDSAGGLGFRHGSAGARSRFLSSPTRPPGRHRRRFLAPRPEAATPTASSGLS